MIKNGLSFEMDVNEPTASDEAKPEAFSSKTKRTFVIGVVNTSGMKSGNASRKRRWDQPPDEDDNVPAKVIVREMEPEPDEPGMVCESERNVEDYDSQYDECVNANNVVPSSLLDDPPPEDMPTVPVSDGGKSASNSAGEGGIDSKLETSGEPSVVENKPDNLPLLPDLEVPTAPTNETDGNIDSLVEKSSIKTSVDQESINDDPRDCEAIENQVAEKDSKVEVEAKKAVESETDAKTNVEVQEMKTAVPEKPPTPEKIDEKKVGKPVAAIPVILSDSLKAIQFCYDEDSNSTEGSEEEVKIEKSKSDGSTKVDDGCQPEKVETVNLETKPAEQGFKPDLEVSEERRRSPTPVLPDELDENSTSELAIDQIAMIETKTDDSNELTKIDLEANNDKPISTELTTQSEDLDATAESIDQTEVIEQSLLGEVQSEDVEMNQDEKLEEHVPNVDLKTIMKSPTEEPSKVMDAVGLVDAAGSISNTDLIKQSSLEEKQIDDVKSDEQLKVKVSKVDVNSTKQSSTEMPSKELQEIQIENIEADQNEQLNEEIRSVDKKEQSPTEVPPKVMEEVQIEYDDSDQKELLDEPTPAIDVNSKTLSPSKVPSKMLEDSASQGLLTVDVVQGLENVDNGVSSKASEPHLLNDKPTRQEELSGKMAKQIDASNDDKPFTDSMDCNSELSLSKDMFIEESPQKGSSVIPSKLLSKESDEVGHDNLISMDNSQNCVGFGDLNEKVISKSPELELRYSDSEEDSNKAPPEVTMHFASFRTPEYVSESIAESIEKDIEDESSKAIDALISANPDLSDKAVELPEPASSDTMEMLDSLVRRSSEDDPSRIQRGEGMLSEDSLINEINQLPDDDDKKLGLDKTEDSVEPVVESASSDSKKGPTAVEGTKKSSVIENVDLSDDTSPTVTAALEQMVEATCEDVSKDSTKRESAKSEPGISVEDDLSQGGEEESKNVNVSSENILEVIFGSKQDNKVHTIRSMDRDGDSEVAHKTEKESKPTDGSCVGDSEPKPLSRQEESADDAKLQLDNEEIENDDTEIVMVDPTKSLSGEDTDNDAEDVCFDTEGSSTKKTAEVSSTVSSDTEGPSNKKTAEVSSNVSSDVEGSSNKKAAEVSSNVSSAVDVAPSDVAMSQSSSKLTGKSELVEKMDDSGMNDDVVKETAMEVDESNTPDTKTNETSVAEISVAEPVVDVAKVVKVDKSAAVKPRKETKVSEASHAKEPSVPVLIIKKQSMPSKKDGDKRTVETLLTCSPKSSENSGSDSTVAAPKKLPNEILQIETSQELGAGSNSPKHSPITLRIYKDNLTVKTDLDSPKRNKSPMSSEFKSELSPKMRSPSVSENLSPQNKQLEFTLKIAKDVNTNYPKATMSPKNVSSPTSVWKSEVQIADSPSVLTNVEEVKTLPTRGRGRGRGRGATPHRGRFARGRRGGHQGRIIETPSSVTENADASSSSAGLDIVIKQEVLTEDEKSQGSSVCVPASIQMHDMFKKMMSKEAEGSSTPESSVRSEVQTPRTAEVITPVVRKRGRPRKSALTPIVVPEEIVIVKQEPSTPVETTPPVIDGGETDDGSSSTGRPKRTCRGRTKPIVVKKRKPRGGAAAGVPRGGAAAGVPRGASTPILPIEIKQENVSTPPAVSPALAMGTTPTVTTTPVEATTPESTTVPAVIPSPPVDTTPTPPARGRGGFKRPTPDRNTLSEKELAELQKIEAKKEKLRLDRIAKYEAKKAKKLAKKLKDEERRKRLAREKAEKAEAAAPQVFEEETRMSAPDSSNTGQTPGPNRILTGDGLLDESQNSISTPGDTNKGNKKGRMEISITDMDCLVKEVRVDELAEYQWQGSELFMIQEQVSLYLGVKSFKRKYPGLKRRPVEAEERTFLEDSGLVPKSMCDLGLTAVGSAEILDIMFQDFPEKYEEFRKHVRDKQAREASFRQRAAIGLQRKDGAKVEPREQALEAVAAWNANLNRERREERRCALDLQTFTVHYPKLDRENMKRPVPKVGLYPVAVIPGQFCDHYKKYTPNELMYFPVNTVLYGPLRPNERHRDGSDDGSGSESSSSSSSSSSSGESSSESESEGEDPARCKMCNGTKKKNKDSIPEVLLTCVQCKSCYHPTCKEFTPEMIVHLTKYEWQCTACKKCTKCRDPNLKDRIMSCQLCDRGYHLSCIGLKKMPEGRWHCTVCAYCSSCSSRNPGGSDWQHEFKKGEKGVKIYQRTLCTPCFKLWRKGKYCQLCSKCHCMKPEEDPNLIQCNSCDRWLHKECYGTKYGLTNKLMSTSSIQCDFCVERITVGNQGLNRSLIKV
ncbi:hypothetical protein GE061_018879 [Apolygus lucorum]|uniref:PHD-type domain-containing protein n=1 Tax=Apolygus lucorum TaxID=248454 RepID=A0A6A4JQ88_APOLU|nr:hypothetical protein GE061_018879 [Apolygus lucorum]